MKNFLYEGKKIDVVLGADTAPGAIVLVGDMVTICIAGGLNGQTVACAFEGVYLLPKPTGAGTGSAQGVKQYFDNAAGNITHTAGALKLAGYAWKASLDADTTIQVRLVG